MKKLLVVGIRGIDTLYQAEEEMGLIYIHQVIKGGRKGRGEREHTQSTKFRVPKQHGNLIPF